MLDKPYDADGNRTSKTTSAGTDTYNLSPGFQLTLVTTPSGAESYSFDDNGRLTSMTRGGSTTALTYSSTDHVTSVDQEGTITSYAFDAAGRRVASTDSAGNREYLVAPSLGVGLDSPHLVVDGVSGSPIAGYVYGGEHALMRYDSAGAQYYLEDAMGSVIGIADAAGTLTQSVDYDAFGNVRGGAVVPATTGGDYRFQGMWLDPTGLYHVRARHYDAETGRFVSKDPAEGSELLPESWHPYMFASNNGNVWRDPTGLISSFGELNTSSSAQSFLRSRAGLHVSDAMDDIVGRFVSSVVEKAIASVAPGIALPFGHISGLGRDELFEQAVEVVACGALGLINAEQFMYREVPVGFDGKPGDDGYQCGDQGDFRELNNKYHAQESRPDFLVSSVPPSEVDTKKKSFLIADAKYAIRLRTKTPKNKGTFYRQLNKMGAHAADYSWSHTVAYVTFSPVKDYSLNKMRKALTKKRARMLVVSRRGIRR